MAENNGFSGCESGEYVRPHHIGRALKQANQLIVSRRLWDVLRLSTCRVLGGLYDVYDILVLVVSLMTVPD